MKHIKTEEYEKRITVELTETELDFIVLAVGEISVAKAEHCAKEYNTDKKIDIYKLDTGALWEGLQQYSNLHFRRNGKKENLPEQAK
jgi:hypothetical protein